MSPSKAKDQQKKLNQTPQAKAYKKPMRLHPSERRSEEMTDLRLKDLEGDGKYGSVMPE